MTTNAAGATVVSLENHPAWRSARRRSRELAEAMRRHPSFQAEHEADPASDTRLAAVRTIGAR